MRSVRARVPSRASESSASNLIRSICGEEGSEARAAPAGPFALVTPGSTAAIHRLQPPARPTPLPSAPPATSGCSGSRKAKGRPPSPHAAGLPAPQPHPSSAGSPRDARDSLPPQPAPARRLLRTKREARPPNEPSDPRRCRLTAAVARLCMVPVPPGRAQKPAAIEAAPRGAPGRGRGLEEGEVRTRATSGGEQAALNGACAAVGGEEARAPLRSVRACREGRCGADVSGARAPACRASRGEPVPAIRRRAPPRAAGTGSRRPSLEAVPLPAGGDAWWRPRPPEGPPRPAEPPRAALLPPRTRCPAPLTSSAAPGKAASPCGGGRPPRCTRSLSRRFRGGAGCGEAPPWPR